MYTLAVVTVHCIIEVRIKLSQMQHLYNIDDKTAVSIRA